MIDELMEVLSSATGAFLLAAAALLGERWLAGRRRAPAEAWAALALAALAVDKLLGLQAGAHRGLHRLGFGEPPLLNGLEDLLLVGLMLVALLVGYRFRRELSRGRARPLLLAVAVVAFAAASGLDAFGPNAGKAAVAEGFLEATTAALIFAMVALARPAASPRGAHGLARRVPGAAGS